jgi:hypothetical protein
MPGGLADLDPAGTPEIPADRQEQLSRKASVHVVLGVADLTAALALAEVFPFLAVFPDPLMPRELANNLRQFRTRECSPSPVASHGA